MTQSGAGEAEPTTRRTGRAYRLDAGRTVALSTAKAAWWTLNGAVARAVTRPTQGPRAQPIAPGAPAPDRSVLRRAWKEAFAKDAADVRAGLYPSPERLTSPLRALATAIDFVIAARAVDRRRRAGDGVEVRAEVDAAA